MTQVDFNDFFVEFVVSYVVIVAPVVILFLLIKTISRLRPKTSLVRTIGRGLPV